MGQFLIVLSIFRQLAPIISEACHLAQELFPGVAGNAKLAFVMGLVETNYPPEASQKLAFDNARAAIEGLVSAAVAVYKVASPMFQKQG